VTVVDTTAPVLTLPEDDVIVEATGPAGAVVTFVATALDDVDGPVDVTCAPVSGSTFRLGDTTVNCSATDATGNEATGSFVVTVEDTTAPTLNLPADMTRLATSAAGVVVNFTASATDLVDGSVTPICVPISGSIFPLGTTTVNCSATDAAGNEATGSFSVTVHRYSGVLSPIKSGSSVFKAGSTVPVKFQLTDANGAFVTDAIARIYLRHLDGGDPEGELIAVSTSAATAGNLFRYDSSANQYIFNLSTKGLDPGDWEITIKFFGIAGGQEMELYSAPMIYIGLKK
jgi:hypothetical protein